jgi:hypothetical protein
MRRRRAALVAGLLVAAALSSLVALGRDGGNARGPQRPAGSDLPRLTLPPPPIEVVDTDDPASPPSCRLLAVTRRLRAFSTALTAGRAARAAQSFASAARFSWYSVAANRRGELQIPPERQEVIRDRGQLRAYFQARGRQHESLRITALAATFNAEHDRTDFLFTARRRADDLRVFGIDTERAQGKGAIDCRTGKLMVLSLAMSYVPQELCHNDTREATKRVIVACSQR